jgi:TctA family transporter
MLDAALAGLAGILEWKALALMLVGILVSCTLVAMPGIGSKTAIALLLPFAFALDNEFQAIALIVSVWAVSNTANSITSILFGIPGGSGSQATILDGYPMARRGEAARALSASFLASAMGGVFGAVLLFLAIPILRPLVLLLGRAELFMLVMLGVAMVGTLSGKKPIKGIVAGMFGLLVSMIGLQGLTGVPRYDGGQLYLWEGIPLIPLALGLFAIPELVALVARDTSIAEDSGAPVVRDGLRRGVVDTLQHTGLVVRSSFIGIFVGIIPGLGSSVADWFAYAQAKQTLKGARDSFGSGDVRGLIAVDASTNAKEAGALMPTLAFGIPGSSTLALIFGALLVVGVQPGRELLTTRLDITFSLIWLLILSNVVASGICMAFAARLAQITKIQPVFLAPVILGLSAIGSFASSYRIDDVIVMVAFGTLGYFMRVAGWPRPPLLLGFVLGPLAEVYFWSAWQLYGPAFLVRPGVLTIFVLLLVMLFYPLVQMLRETRMSRLAGPAGEDSAGLSP